jgi:prepilin-type N-terminal cleavage/methylation domain-containing protein
MKTASLTHGKAALRRAYTLVELLVATAVGTSVAGIVLLTLCQTATEQRCGFADMTLEEKAYQLRANLTSCLRTMSANQGMTPDYTSGLYDGNGNLLGYQSIFVFYPSNGTYISGEISYNSAAQSVTYVSNILSSSSTSVLWASSNSSAGLTQFYFTSSYNVDGSQNNSLVNVQFQMNDNGFSGPTVQNNAATLFRSFSVQMRNDN